MQNGRVGRPPRYSAFSLLRNGLGGNGWPQVWRSHDLRSAYDVVIVGAGVHGLATAYYLASRHGLRNVAILERGYIGGGGSGRRKPDSPDQSRRMRPIASTTRSARTLSRSTAWPMAACSTAYGVRRFPPAPRPRSNRPPDTA